MSEPNATDRSGLDLLLRGFQVSRMLRLVADLGIAHRIAPGGQVTIVDLAAQCNVLRAPLLRILRALAAFGVFSISSEDLIGHTPRSQLLRSDAPGSLHHAARFWTGPGAWKAWGDLDVALSGGVPHQAAWGMGRFAYLRTHPEEARAFDAMMAAFPDDRHAAIAAAYDFSEAGLICDVGGGDGTALRHILGRFAKPRGLVFDLEDVVKAIPSDGLLNGRITVQGGSFFDGVPAGADIYLAIRVIHNWSDNDARKILQACRRAMSRNSRLLLGEEILQSDSAEGHVAGYLIDTQMMVMFGARARTEAEIAQLLADSDLAFQRVVPTKASVSIVEAVPA